LVEADTLRDIVVAADLARTDVPGVTPEDDLDTVMRIFGGKNRDELPVIADRESRRLLGSISRAHLLEAYNRELLKRDMVAEVAGGLASADHGAVSLGEDHWMKQVSAPGTFVGQTLSHLDVRGQHGVQIVLVRRPRSAQHRRWIEMVPGADTRVELGDVLVVVGPRAAVERLEAL
jgi:CBS domain-containing protein